MQRFVLAALFVAIVIAIGAIVLKGATRVFEGDTAMSSRMSGTPMQKVAFFLLLALMIYVSMSGAR